ncbi:sensor histidine kinase [Ferruginibacter profundus]
MQSLNYDSHYFEHPLFFALSDNMREGAAIIEAATRKFIYCNQSFLNLFGIHSLEDITIELIRILRKDAITAAIIAEREKIIREKKIFYELVEYRSLQGETFFAEASTRLYTNKGTDYFLYIITPVDKTFFEAATMAILMVNKAGEIATINSFALQLFGYEKKEIIGKKIEHLIPARFHHTHVAHRHEYIQQSQNRSMGVGMDLFALKKDGTEFPVEVSLGNYCTDGHTYTIAFINDISFRKEAETKLKTLNEELEFEVEQRTTDLKKTLHELEISKAEQQRIFSFQKALLDNAGVMIVSVDTAGIIQAFNQEAERELGYKAAELIGKFKPLIYHDPTLVVARAKALSKELRKDVPPGMELFHAKARLGLLDENEWMYVRKDGTKFPVQLSITAMKDDEGNITGYVDAAVNISKLKKIELDLQQALEREKELSELKSRFVSMASHEFRTPLSTVLSSSYLIEKYTSTAEQPKRELHLQRIVTSVKMLSDILNDFLSVGKIEEGKLHARFSTFDIKEFITGVIDEMNGNLQKHQKINYQHQGDNTVYLDISLLKHILLNLISNASKFSPQKSMIEIKTWCSNGHLKLSVKDYGMGISETDQQHLTERFFRGANATNIQGTGLGLHIVSKYAELMNGTVRCKSETGKGAEFILTFTSV